MAGSKMAKSVSAIEPLTKGEKLMILIFRAKQRNKKLKMAKIADAMGVAEIYIPRLYTKNKLTKKVIQSASAFFNVPPEIFQEDYTIKEMSHRLDMLERMVANLVAEELQDNAIVLQGKLIGLQRQVEDLTGTKTN